MEKSIKQNTMGSIIEKTKFSQRLTGFNASLQSAAGTLEMGRELRSPASPPSLDNPISCKLTLTLTHAYEQKISNLHIMSKSEIR